ncbi:MAG: molybdopterin converting factor subunit 1 [Acidobacteriia bacterium]|nr:molybdopterin converting factor subunit 1 [Methyloceanibacter sp.]MCL6492514.1 molybdopterin converting factor subunit 1 [Terriglobia bacterium]
MVEKPVHILYFAWLRERVGVAEETVVLPDEVRCVGDLISWLQRRGDGYARAFADTAPVRCAVNQTFADFSAAVAPGDEVAFFPPVTGG